MSTASREPFTLGTILRSHSGRTYKIEEVLSYRRNPLPCVYRASAGAKSFIVKDVISGEFEYQLDLQKSLSGSSNIRTVADTIRDNGHEMFIYPFLTGDLLRLARNPSLTAAMRRNILRNALQGLAYMHERDVLHNDIKPDNILVGYEESVNDGITVTDVQVSDLDDAVIVPPGKWLRGPLCGNAMWRSPESWCRAAQNQASDVFSFAIVMIYVMENEMVFRVDDTLLASPDSWRHILSRHISYFGDLDGLQGLLVHIGENNDFFPRLLELAEGFGKQNPRQPVGSWVYLEPRLKDLVGRMTNLDPNKRVTAKEALGHEWFNDVVHT
ncbi:uncharacterized protein DSM5745_09430 [Aspergillus mulundensis]|uniref:Protein kinase domain-containing protein n=1 Tax=Aspergillus mulundensis TaxID=1810919 RepID=A0A3D8QVH4_9EURO|nr:Uncharacterized protein DSM5745_09430 [Aspergillus mulundensis]RDW65691.1 Uncharacterized protein DSM5745_09430 [Aspergillus mulundensis]